MKKIHSFFMIFIGSFCLLCFLLAMIFFYNSQSNRVKSAALEAMTVLAEWNKLENSTNDILLNRYTQFGTESSPVIEDWERNYKNFEKSLEELMNNPILERQPEISERLNGAYRVWRFTEVKLNNAGYYFKQIIKSGLGEKVMVNGMIHTMYQLRMLGQLDVDEILLLDETIYALESLDNATDEFDYLFQLIVRDMNAAGEIYLKRIAGLIVALFSSAILLLLFVFLINRQLKTAQLNRRIYLESEKARLMRGLCTNSSEEELALFRKKQLEYELGISIDKPVLLIMFQIDDFRAFSHHYNIEEQHELISRLCDDFTAVLEGMNCDSEYFMWDDERVVFMLNADAQDDSIGQEPFERKLRDWHKTARDRHSFSVSITHSDICFDNQDLDRDFEYIWKLSEYHYLIGNEAYIYPGSWKMVPKDDFRYPNEKERLFEDAFKSLDRDGTLLLLSEMIDYAEPYGPESVKRLVIRLTASLASVVELLERSHNLSISDGVTPTILAIRKTETLKGARDMLEGIVVRVIEACQQKKSEKHDNTVEMIKEIINRDLSDFNLSADQIADHFNLTASYINRLFKQYTSFSISGYINECRLRHAEQLLQGSDKTVVQVAGQSGFASMGTFFRLFKKKYGCTPGEMAAKRE